MTRHAAIIARNAFYAAQDRDMNLRFIRKHIGMNSAVLARLRASIAASELRINQCAAALLASVTIA